MGRLTRCFKVFNLPVLLAHPHISAFLSSRLLTVDCLLQITKRDKKDSGPEKKMVILSAVETTASVVRDSMIAKTLSEAVKVVPGVLSDPVRTATLG